METLKISFEAKDEILEEKLTNQEKVKELLNRIGNVLDSPEYAALIIGEAGKEILSIIDNLENEVKVLRESNKELKTFADLMRKLP